MELENNVTQPMFLSNMAYMKEEHSPFETPCPSPKGFLQGLVILMIMKMLMGHHQIHFLVSKLVLSLILLMPSLMGHHQILISMIMNASHLQAISTKVTGMVKSLNFEEVKPVRFSVQDEVSCVSSAENECRNKMG
uniref:Uncharacterized protein n=1 Tax=Salix viminalis TaxID=40686 RepID=A0A6N2ME56_SALVM